MIEIYHQCSRCWRKYTYEEHTLLPVCFVNPKNKKTQKMYGKTTVCFCGAIFFKDRWQTNSYVDQYWISTVHLHIGHGSTHNWIEDSSFDYYFETMIHNNEKKEWLGFQMRYKTMDEAIAGHWQTVDMLPDILANPEAYPQSIIDMFCNAGRAYEDQKKNIQSAVKDRLR